LMSGIIRTPLNPLVTFKDDPLRILRAVRFAARFAFSLDDALVQAARTPEVHLAFDSKVSRERMLKELDGMLSHHMTRPALALMYIHYIGIYHLVFKIPADVTLPASPASTDNSSTSSALEKVNSDAKSNLPAQADSAALLHTEVSSVLMPMYVSAAGANACSLGNAICKALDTVYWVNILRCIRSAGWSSASATDLTLTSPTSAGDAMEVEAGVGASRPGNASADSSQTQTQTEIETETKTESEVNTSNLPPDSFRTHMEKEKEKDIRTSETDEPRCVTVEEQCHAVSSSVLSRAVYFAAATNMLREFIALDKKNKEVPVPILLLKDALKMDTDTIKAVQAMHESIPSFQDLAVRYASFTREEGGILLRLVRENWREALWISCADQLAGIFPRSYNIPPPSAPAVNVVHTEKQIFQSLCISVSSISSTMPQKTYSSSSSSSGSGSSSSSSSSSNTVVYDTIVQFALLEQRLLELQLDRVWELKPLLDGNRLMQAVGLKRGPLVGTYFHLQVCYML